MGRQRLVFRIKWLQIARLYNYEEIAMTMNSTTVTTNEVLKIPKGPTTIP